MRIHHHAPAAILAIAMTPWFVDAEAGLEWRDDVTRFAQSLVDASLVPAMAIAVTQDERVVYSRTFGLADAATGRRADEGTAFYIASSTKALTATAVLAMANRGALDLGASLARYLPALRGRGQWDADAVTLRDLLTMSHGIRDDGAPVEFRTAYTGEFTPRLLIDLLAGHRQSGAREFRYGNLGYNILGLVLDAQRAHGWKDIVEREVLDPLGMRETSARVSDFPLDAIALPHAVGVDGRFGRIRLAKADANMHAAGGHFATARDLARFVAAHAANGRVDGVQVFPAEMIASAHRTQITQSGRFGPFLRSGWGYGWDVGNYGDDRIVSRFGGFTGYRSHMSFMPERGTGVVVLVNAGGPASVAADVMATYIYDRLDNAPTLEATYKARVADVRALVDAAQFNAAKDLADRRAPVSPLIRPAQDYAGVFENARFGRMEWSVSGAGLESRMGVAHSPAEVFDAARHQFRVDLTGRWETVDFSFTAGADAATVLRYRGEIFQRVTK